LSEEGKRDRNDALKWGRKRERLLWLDGGVGGADVLLESARKVSGKVRTVEVKCRMASFFFSSTFELSAAFALLSSVFGILAIDLYY
jgi:hypothetical protein